MPNEYETHLKPDTKPLTCLVHRRTVNPLIPKVKVYCVEKLGVISKDEQPDS